MCSRDRSKYTVIKTNNIAPVAIVFPNKAIAVLPSASVSPIMPEPIIVDNNIVVPKNSEKYARIFILFYLTNFVQILLYFF